MIGIVESYGELCMLADIKSVQHVEQFPQQAEHYLLRRHSGAQPLKLFSHDYRDLLARPVQIIPAEPGIRLVIVYPQWGDDPTLADVLPILAWALCMDGQTRPMLPSGVRRGYNPTSIYDWHPDYIMLADGSLYEYGFEAEHERYDSIDAVLAAETARAKRYALERAEQAAQKSEMAS